MSRVRPACGPHPTGRWSPVNINDIAASKQAQATINTDVGGLSLLRALNEGAK